MIPPNLDWRQNAGYKWKLDNAWMSDTEWGWLHWNSNSYINSAIQLPSSNDGSDNKTLLECDVMEFHFESILPSGFRRSRDPIVTDTRVVLSDVKLGAYLDSTDSRKYKAYNPCHPSVGDGIECTIVDGAIASSTSVPSNFKHWRTSSATLGDWWSTSPIWQKCVGLGFIAALLTMAMALFANLVQWCHYRQRTKRYQAINPVPEEEDLALQEDEIENFEDDTQD